MWWSNAAKRLFFSGTGVPAGLRREAAKLLGFRLRRNAGTEAGATDFLATLRILTAATVLLLLGGCGFHPLYGQSALDPAVMQELASVHVDPLRDRQGQLIHNALLTSLSPRGEAAQARYRLVILLTINEAQQALRTDDTATRDVLYYNITFYLYEGPTAVTAGTFSQVYSYDFLQEHYADISAQEDVQRRAASAIANEIRNRLAAYFTTSAVVKARASQTR